MLARTFKTSNELGISDVGHSALIQVLGLLESGEIKDSPDAFILLKDELYELYTGLLADDGFRPDYFDMKTVLGDTNCGTIACLLGWAKCVAHDEDLFDEHGPNDFTGNGGELDKLFAIDNSAVMSGAWRANTKQAARALRGYLETGKVDWEDALRG